ncbi:MAG: lipopolysaccharide biosynthesis protein [Acidimicrobiia bacterium]
MTSPRPFHRRVVLNTIASGAGNAWAMVVALVSVPLLLAGLGSTAFGLYALLLTFSAVSGWFSLADLGVWTATTRMVASSTSVGDHHEATQVARTALVTVALVGLAGAALFAVVGSAALPTLFHAPDRLAADLRAAIGFFSVTIVLDLATETAQACLEGYQRVDLSRASDAFRRFLFAGATCTAALTGGGLRGVAIAGAAAAALGAVVGLWLLRPFLVTRFAHRDPFALRAGALLRAGRTVAVLRPLGVIERTMNRTIVGIVLGPAAVTFVEIATQVQNGADAVLSASSYAVVPTASWLGARAETVKVRDMLLRGTKYAVAITGFVSVLGMFLAAPAMRVWVGSAAGASSGLAVLGLVSVLMVAPIAVGSNLLLGLDRASAILRAAGAAIVVNGVASLVLVHVVGAAGAFVATLAANLVVVPMLVRSFLRVAGVPVREFLRRALLPSLLPLAALAGTTGIVVATNLGDVATVVIGAVLGTAMFVIAARVTVLSPSELRELGGALARPRSTIRGEALEGVSVA